LNFISQQKKTGNKSGLFLSLIECSFPLKNTSAFIDIWGILYKLSYHIIFYQTSSRTGLLRES